MSLDQPEKNTGIRGTEQAATEHLETEFNQVPGDGHSSCESHEMFRGGDEFVMFEEGEEGPSEKDGQEDG